MEGEEKSAFEDLKQTMTSPEFSSCVSMKSNNSISTPPVFSNGSVISNSSIQTATSPELSYVSMRSNNSISTPPVFSEGTVTPDISVCDDLIQFHFNCGVCKQYFRNAVSVSCGHMQCIRLHCQSGHSGDFDCPYRTCPVLNPHDVTGGSSSVDTLAVVKERYKTSMKNKYENLSEIIKSQENQTLLNQIYTQLYFIEGESQGVNEEHEILQMEKNYKTLQDTAINCNDIFDPLIEPRSGNNQKPKKSLKTVLTKGIAGIGKTVSVQKFILDWAEEKANRDVDFMFVFPFRELNLIKNEQYSLHQLLLDFHPELKNLDPKVYEEYKVGFIFDGLDESRITMKFSGCKKVSDVTKTASVGLLMSNLIIGELLPSALIWITSRPTAANQIPSEFINRVTEIQGFTDPQKEEYFRKRIRDEHQSHKIISHIKKSKSLHIMCHIPVFCWISSTVLQDILKNDNSAEIPKTLTEMYIHFLLFQINMRGHKYENDPDNGEMIVKLAELAFKQLMKGNVMFYEEDLRECSIDVTEASVYSGICTEVFKEESVIYDRKVYCFIHRSFQEFLGALYVFYCYLSQPEPLKGFDSLHNLHKRVVDKSLDSENGHLDLFVRFLLGISLDNNQRLLKNLLTYTEKSSESIRKTIHFIQDEIKKFLIPIKPEFNYCNLTAQCCKIVASALQSSDSVLKELDLSNNDLQDSGVKILAAAMKNPNCKLETLRLSGCMVTEEGCSYLASALKLNPSHLTELDLSYNHPGDSGVKLLSDLLEDPHYKLDRLSVEHGGPSRLRCTLRKYACDLTLDPNTAHNHLILSNEYRKVKHAKEIQLYPDHPERFEHFEQVLCTESLTERCYWEAEWSGKLVHISMAYKGISRKGERHCSFGKNDKSWCIFCTEKMLTTWHNSTSSDIRVLSTHYKRIGVYLDWSAGILSFYSVSDTDKLTHLHTYYTNFTEPLYAGFSVFEATVSLCQLRDSC
ncbi:NACHT, LRR and PYD domains-containing protein 3-like [Paramisgurnus dabryanus]|uniref:NACHT, LRR and PYD domains-containing protein 3-like n=1 Tax=Paramisgurnus dabryanus TaxID=90735 RepID=UPI003CCF04C8